MGEYIIPSVTTNISGHDQVTNTISYELEKSRTIYLNGEVNSLSSQMVISQLRYLDSKSKEDITLIINSPGGSVSDGLAIYDCMKYGIACDVVCVASGLAASMGAFLVAAGTPGKRYATQNAEIMIHQPIGGVQGQATDITLVAEHIQRTKKKLATILADECGKSVEKLMEDTERDNWMSSEEALAYGLVDHVGFPTADKEASYDYKGTY